MKSISADYGCL